MSDYTPTTEAVRINYIGTHPDLVGEDRPWLVGRAEEFDRWLKQIKEEAYWEGFANGSDTVYPL